MAESSSDPENDVPDDYRWECSLSYMTRAATKARSRTTSEWISHVGDERRYIQAPHREGFPTAAAP